MNISQLKLIHDVLTEGDWVAAAQLALHADGIEVPVETKAQAEGIMYTLLQNLLDSDQYLEASALLWSSTQFNSEPEVVRRVFKALHENSRLLIMGASSLSKTYSAGVFMYLDWRRDPLYTSVKLVAVSDDHLRKNLHSHITALHRNAVIPMREKIVIRDTDLFMGIEDWPAEFSISGLAVKQSTLASGSLRGHKPKPYRAVEHPRFGFSSRVRVLIDEAQNVPVGAFEDIKTIEASISGLDVVKICVCFNPIDMSVHPVIMATPPDGWTAEQLETLYSYTGRSGYAVLRLDGAKFENVVQRKTIYPNFLTYEAYVGFLAGGDNSATYYALGRGFPPLEDSAHIIIPMSNLMSQRGTAIYIDKVVQVAACDIALQGGDHAGIAIGRWGLASAWRKWNNQTVFFEDPLHPGTRRPRWCLTIDQLLQLPRSNDTVTMVGEITGRCHELDISPEWVCMDCTGNAMGVWSHAVHFWGNVLGIAWNEKATDRPVLFGDKALASSVYKDIPTEMWWSFARWLDPLVGAVLLSPVLGDNPWNSKVSLTMQLASRRFHFGAKLKCESKEEWKARNSGQSPDEADCCIQLVHLLRMRGGALPGVGADVDPNRGPGGMGRLLPIEGKPEKDATDPDDRLEIEGDGDTPGGGMEVAE